MKQIKQHYIEQNIDYRDAEHFISTMWDRYPELKSLKVKETEDGCLYCEDKYIGQTLSQIWAVAFYLEYGRNIIYIDRTVLEQLKDGEEPSQELVAYISKHFPFRGAYVDAPLDDEMIGFFVAPNPNNPDVMFNFAPYFTKEGREKHIPSSMMHEYADTIIKFIFSCCAFIASVNAGINLKYKPAKEAKYNNKKKRSRCTWYEVGFRIGSEIREYERTQSVKQETDSTVRPHIRRAHWHHYWKGSKDNKHLVLKWIAQTTVGLKNGEISPTLRSICGDAM